MANLQALNGASLAYIGDAIYEVYVRKHLLDQGLTQSKDLQEAAVKYVSAKGQSQVIRYWIQADLLTDEEILYYKRGRNYKTHSKAKNASIGDYRQATGFESLLGFLYLEGQIERLEELVDAAFDQLDAKEEDHGCQTEAQ